MSEHVILIDDTNPGINYTGPWKTITNATQNFTGIRGTAYQNTLHGVTGNDIASFFFPFNGSGFSVYGTYILNGTQGPTWDCFIDTLDNPNATILNNRAPNASQHNWNLCDGQVPDGNHTLIVNAYVPDEQTLWFDQLMYLPSANVSLNQSNVRTDSTDATITYSDGWFWFELPSNYTRFFGNTHFTNLTGAWFTFNFTGTSISCFGIPSNASATYFVDNQSATPFPVVDFPNVLLNLTTDKLFGVDGLPPGQHKLNVEYLGNGTPPLYLSYLIQESEPFSPHNSSTTIHRKSIINGFIGLFLITVLLNILQSHVL